jgi:hypothetical protein
MIFEDIKVNDIVCNKYFNSSIPILVTSLYSPFEHLCYKLMIDKGNMNPELSKKIRSFKNNELTEIESEQIKKIINDQLLDDSIKKLLEADKIDIYHSGVSLFDRQASVNVHNQPKDKRSQQTWAIHKHADNYFDRFSSKSDYEWNLVTDSQIINRISESVEPIKIKSDAGQIIMSLTDSGLILRQSYNNEYITELSMKDIAKLKKLLNNYIID